MFGLSGLSAALSAVIVVLTIAGYILFSSLVATKAELLTSTITISAMQKQAEVNKEIRKGFELSHKNVVLQYQALEEQYKKDQPREHIVVAKPTLVQKLTNNKFKKQERDMACLTGNDLKCVL